MDKGVYSLLIELEKEQKIKIGKLGKLNFPKGFYIYTGSAMNNLEKRIERHFRKNKKKFWHIDYFLLNKHANIISVLKIKTNQKIECELNKKILKKTKGKFIMKKFGSSDCNCESHFIYIGNKIHKKQIIFDEIYNEFNRLSTNFSCLVQPI